MLAYVCFNRDYKELIMTIKQLREGEIIMTENNKEIVAIDVLVDRMMKILNVVKISNNTEEIEEGLNLIRDMINETLENLIESYETIQ